MLALQEGQCEQKAHAQIARISVVTQSDSKGYPARSQVTLGIRHLPQTIVERYETGSRDCVFAFVRWVRDTRTRIHRYRQARGQINASIAPAFYLVPAHPGVADHGFVLSVGRRRSETGIVVAEASERVPPLKINITIKVGRQSVNFRCSVRQSTAARSTSESGGITVRGYTCMYGDFQLVLSSLVHQKTAINPGFDAACEV